MYSIYLITNIVNKKLYVGYTSKTIEKRWAEHISQSKSSKFKFYKAIRKYGIESFIITLILECQDKNEATLKEKYYIEKYNSIKNGYNTHSGGHGGNTGAYDKVSKKVSGEKNGMFGKTHSPETIEEIKKKICIMERIC